MSIVRTVCAVVAVVAASGAGRCESVFDVEADAFSPDLGALPALPSYGYGSGEYQFSPGYAYTSDDSENLTLTTNVFVINGYSEGISLDSGPITLQPLLQGAGWWTISYGTGELDDGTTVEDGETFAFEASTASDKGIGMRVGYSYIGADSDNLWIETNSLSVFFDYMEGGRISLNASTVDVIAGAGIYLINDTVNWGVDWTQVFGVSRSWLSLGASWARVENRWSGALPINFGDHIEARLAFYPTAQFGVTCHGMQERGDSGDRDGYGGGFLVDMEQVRLSVDFSRTDVDGTPAESREKWTVSLGMRF